MQALIEVILPVFMVIGIGYMAAWKGGMSHQAIDGLMSFAQNYAVPCLLFRAMWQLDVGPEFKPSLLLSFYTGSAAGFTLGLMVARHVFKRNWEDAVAIAFCCLFANTVLLGIPISERAFGTASLSGNFAIVSIHPVLCYATGIIAMEIARARGASRLAMARQIAKGLSRNALVIGVITGLSANAVDLQLPKMITDALDMMIRAALPAALFGMGGVLYRYRPEGNAREIAFCCAVSLIMHPTITWTMGTTLDLSTDAMRSAVMTAAMAPGINAYVFANMYGRARRVVASSVLIATALSVFTAWFWLSILP